MGLLWVRCDPSLCVRVSESATRFECNVLEHVWNVVDSECIISVIYGVFILR